jgi:hypothetical protein
MVPFEMLCRFDLHDYKAVETRATESHDKYITIEQCTRCHDIKGKFVKPTHED